MIEYDSRVFFIDGKGDYENFLDEDGIENEFLGGVGLTDGFYCKHYTQARDWSDMKFLDCDGMPYLQHYCRAENSFMGVSYCCGSHISCFEKGKSAGLQRLRNKIRKERGMPPPRRHTDEQT